jgi:hypothetical protein
MLSGRLAPTFFGKSTIYALFMGLGLVDKEWKSWREAIRESLTTSEFLLNKAGPRLELSFIKRTSTHNSFIEKGWTREALGRRDAGGRPLRPPRQTNNFVPDF